MLAYSMQYFLKTKHVMLFLEFLIKPETVQGSIWNKKTFDLGQIIQKKFIIEKEIILQTFPEIITSITNSKNNA